jgi:hypothetical protein
MANKVAAPGLQGAYIGLTAAVPVAVSIAIDG